MTQYAKLKTPAELVAAYLATGSLKAAGRRHKTHWGTVHRLYEQAIAAGLMDRLPRGTKSKDHITKTIKGKLTVRKPKIGGKNRAAKATPLDIKKSGVTRFIFTCAQNNTKLHDRFWTNLLALKDYYEAELHISRFSYIKHGLGAEGDKKQWFAAQEVSNNAKGHEDFWFDSRLAPYLSDEQRKVAPGLVWRGDANISPTAVNPLSGKGGMTGRKSGIFPHVTIAMESVPSMEANAVKFLYTTGTVTLRNYIQRDAGFKADFHHTYGALLVEVFENHWWCRQINADSEGNFQDLDVVVKDGEVWVNNPVEAIVWGDVHVANADKKALEIAFGEDGVLDYLQPKHQFFHDTLDMYARNHHDIKDPHQLALRYAKRQDNVRRENADVAAFYDYSHREWCKSHAVNSNHDRALLLWLKNHHAMLDPANFQFWSELNNRVLQKIAVDKDYPVILREAYLSVTGLSQEPSWLHFLAQDESYIVCPDKGGGIECGQHGDDGPGGSRGTTASFTNIGRRMSKGHDHRAAIKQNVHSVGTFRKLQVDKADYAHGPSSWSCSHDIIYPSAKRAIITFWAGRPWAPR